MKSKPSLPILSAAKPVNIIRQIHPITCRKSAKSGQQVDIRQPIDYDALLQDG